MKLMLTGVFIAAAAAPVSLVVGFYAFSRFQSGMPVAIELAATTSALLLGLACFTFMGGLVKKVKVHPVPLPNSAAWEAKK